MARSLLLALLLLCVSPSSLPAADTLAMQQIAVLPFRTTGKVPCGDADRDGRREMYLQSPEWYTEVLEHAGGNRFDSTYLGADYADCWVLGDADRDGRSDLVLQVGQVLFVYESPDSQSLPHNPVWFDTLLYSAFPMDASTPDLDRDSAREVVVHYSSEGLVRLYECTADNQFRIVADLHREPPAGFPMLPCPTNDLDGDGKPELVIGAENGYLQVHEAVADDSFPCVAVCSLHYNSHNRRIALAGAPDMDRDGRNELIALSGVAGGTGVLAVYESPEDDSFAVVWKRGLSFGNWAHQICVGDMDCDSVPEFAVYDGVDISLWRCAGPDSFEQFWLGDPYWPPMTIYDINSDGRGELICNSYDGTAILEWLPVGIQERALERLELETSYSSLVARGAVLRLPVRMTATVHDALGRMVAVPTEAWKTDGLAPGAYFIRISSGSQSLTRKVLILP